MKRRLFNILTIFSLLLCVVTLVMWMSSIRLGDLATGEHWVGDAEEKFGHFELDTDLPVLFRYGWHVGSNIRLPYWPIAVATAIMPIWWLGKRIMSRRQIVRWRKMGCCLQCGYDLRASKERCPECGTAIATGANA